MKTHDVQQGSDAWLALRTKHFCASEAAEMLGFGKIGRNELLRLKHTGAEREFSDWVRKNLLDKGHEIEAAACPIAESIIGESLFPSTGTDEVEGLPLLASFDGLTMDDSTVWECKSRNSTLIAALEADDLPDSHWPQVEQQLLISGAEKALFMVSDGTAEGTVTLTYESKPARRAMLIAGWKQFAEDLANFKPVEVIPAAVAAPISDLPALSVEISGRVLASNIDAWQKIVADRIGQINTDLVDDQSFADAERMVKFLDDGEKRIDVVKSQAQAQATDIDAVFRAMDDIKAMMRAKRLELDKLVKARKESIRVEILNEGKAALDNHVATLNQRLGKNYMPAVVADFAGVMKGKKTIKSLRDAVADELARAKIESNAIADRIEINLNYMRENAKDYPFLFADAGQIVLKANDDFETLAKLRIADHKAEEERKLEAERARIRAEEEAKARAEAEAKLRVEQEEAERLRKEQAKPVEPVAQPAAPAASPSSGYVQAGATVPDSSLRQVLDPAGAWPIQKTADPGATIPAPEVWKAACDRVVALLDNLSVSELDLVADYISRRGWAGMRVAA